MYNKKHKTLKIDPPIHVHINRINNRLVFIKKDGYKLELFGSTKKLINKTKNSENVASTEAVEVV